ncbi:MAG TPA: S53 family peptidase [Mycobacteriales bacterium]|nr:S53 family peptidase [Mycobacteriales bacterium]
MRRSLAALGVGAAGIAAATFAAGPALGAPDPTPAKASVAGTAPSWAASATVVGKPAATANVTFSVVLPLRSAQTVDQLARAVSDPTSLQYHQYLTPKQFNAQFAPKDSSVKSVSSYLKSQGLKVTGVAAGNRWVNASGSVAAVNKAFGTSMTTFSHQGTRVTAPAHAASVPTSVKPQIVGITGLDSGSIARTNHVTVAKTNPSAKAAPKAKAPTPSLCSGYWAQHSQTVPQAYSGKDSYPTYICGYTPDQLQSAYNLKKSILNGTDGKGVTVAITDAYGSPTMLADANQYATNQDQPTFAKGQYTQKLFKPFTMQDECGGEAGWNGEETLDVEAVHAVAPGAKIAYYGAQNCDQGLNDALNYIVQNHSADIVSNSWSSIEALNTAADLSQEHSIFLQGAIEGIGFYASTGDNGDNLSAGAPQASPGYPASDPYVTGVGGTSLGIDAAGNYEFESGWGSDIDRVDTTNYETYTEPLPGEFSIGAGGGTSGAWDQPWYQKKTVPAALSKKYGGDAARVSPDVAMNADPYTGFLIGETTDGTYGESSIGGTSLSTPLFAGLQALASQDLGTSIGSANPTLYALGAKAFRDIMPTKEPVAIANPSGSYLLTFDRDSSLLTTYGYDDVTGIGSPNGPSFLKAEGRIAAR